MGRFGLDPCVGCEEVLQSYLDRVLDEAEQEEAERHLDECGYCAKRYRFELSLRRFVRRCCYEEMPPDLKLKLRSLQTPL
jgi:mycothiol system anti-sigma-R factor